MSASVTELSLFCRLPIAGSFGVYLRVWLKKKKNSILKLPTKE
jgi:hypothetical protein